MNYPKISNYKTVYIEIGADISATIDNFISVKNEMCYKGLTNVLVDDVEHGLVSFRGERDMTPEEMTEYTQRYLLQEVIDRKTYVQLKAKYGWS